MGLNKKTARIGWSFVLPAVLLILFMSVYLMIEAFILSLYKGKGNALRFAGFANYSRLLRDKDFKIALYNTFVYLIIQVPIMLTLAMALATMLNDPKLKGRGIYRTLIFLPCATSLVSCSIVFKQLFSNNGFINSVLINIGLIKEAIPFLTNPQLAQMVIILTMIWRWTGYNMVFYLAGMQNIDNQVYEAATIDGASALVQFRKITIPLLKPMILFTTVLSTNGTLQLFDEVKNMTNGGPGTATVTMSLRIYNLTFIDTPQFGYASAMAYVIFVLVAILALIQMKVGERT